MAQKISATTEREFARCRCCGARISADFIFCLGCYRKREKIYKDCLAAGKPDSWAKVRVDEVYPIKFV